MSDKDEKKIDEFVIQSEHKTKNEQNTDSLE